MNGLEESSLRAHRDQLFREIINEIEPYTRSRIKRLASISTYAVSNLVAAHPTESALSITIPAGTDPLLLLLLSDEDRGICDFCATHIDEPGWAGKYIDASRLVILKPFIINDPWRMAVLLHEVEHDRQFMDGELTPEKITPEQMTANEIKAHTITNSVILEMGGQAYRTWLRRKVSKLAQWYQNRRLRPLTCLPPDSYWTYDSHLDSIFGIPACKIIQDTRKTLIFVHTLFELADSSFRDPALNNYYKAHAYMQLAQTCS